MFSDLRADDVLAAARRLAGVARRTPLVRSEALSAALGTDVYLKLENEQITGSFKLRGAYNTLASLDPEERERGVVAASAGNHGMGVAWAARALGIDATIFVPRTAPAVKREGIAALGAVLDASQPHYDAALVAAQSFAAARGATFVNPCAGAPLLAGQGTVALEILEELPDVAMIVLPVGGGGLLGGVASLVRRRAPAVRIAGAQSEETAAMARSLDAGRVTEVPVTPTLADGLAGQIDEEALDYGRHGLDSLALVSESAIGETIAWLAHAHEVRAEGSGAVGVAALRTRAIAASRGPVVAIVSGGNIDDARFAEVIAASSV